MLATTRGRGIRENRLAFGSQLCATGENVATELTPGFEWSRRIIILEASRCRVGVLLQSSFPHIFKVSDVSLPISFLNKLCVKWASLVVIPPFLLLEAPIRNW
jgi:hypothetical protein